MGSEKLTAALALQDRSTAAGTDSCGYAAAGEEILDSVQISSKLVSLTCDTTRAIRAFLNPKLIGWPPAGLLRPSSSLGLRPNIVL